MSRTSPEQVRKDLGRRVSEIRRAKGLTQAQLAETSNVSTPYLARVEAGRENLTLDSVTRLANLLEVPVLHLFLPPADRSVRKGRPPREPVPVEEAPGHRRPRRRSKTSRR
jgi:transcriptional regulator with XRE-family HTH domain